LIFMEFSTTTLSRVKSAQGLLDTLPAGYDAFYVDFSDGQVEYTPFDATRPGDVLLKSR
jgi:hypothetical protein